MKNPPSDDFIKAADEKKGKKKRTITAWTNQCTVFWLTELPDLVIDTEALREEMRTQSLHVDFLQCAYEENCLAKSADVLFRYVVP